MRGTWQSTDSGGGKVVLLIVGTLLLFGSGAAVELATAVAEALIAAAAVVVLTVAAGVVWLVYRARQEIPSQRGVIPSPVKYELPAPERPAIAPKRELHIHFHGTDPEQVAEILRRQQAE